MKSKFSARWQADELDHLRSLFDNHRTDTLASAMQLWQKKKKRHIRSAKGIQAKAYQLGYNADLLMDNIAASQLAAMLKIDPQVIYLWRKKGLPCTQKYKNRAVVIKRRDFANWCKANPHELYACDRDSLDFLAGAEILELVPERSPYHRAVRCIETGQIWPTIKGAATTAGVHPVSLARACKHGWRSGGMRWELVPTEKR